MKSSAFILLIVSILFGGCHIENACKTGKDEVLTVTDVEGTLHKDQDYKDYYIRYWIPGTIDSSYRGFVCDDDLDGLSKEEGMNVVFSGTFRETDDYQNVTYAIGGEEIYRLSLSAIQTKEVSDQ